MNIRKYLYQKKYVRIYLYQKNDANMIQTNICIGKYPNIYHTPNQISLKYFSKNCGSKAMNQIQKLIFEEDIIRAEESLWVLHGNFHGGTYFTSDGR